MNRVYIAIDLKSFYASVECVERNLDPLTTNLVVADASRTDKTICLAVSPSLKEYGLKGRSRLFEVEQRLKEVKKKTGEDVKYIIAPPRMSLYLEYSANIYSVYLKYVSKEDIHVYSIDEVFMDVTDYLKLYQMSGHDLAMLMIQDVLHTTGITATAGVATNLYLSKIAMDIVAKHTQADKDGVRIAELNEYLYRKKLWDHKPLTDFWRVGHGISRRLHKHGIETMGQLALASLQDEEWFYKEFGIDAEILIDHAWGYEPCTIKDIKAYKPEIHSLTSGQVLMYPYNKENAKIVLTEMIDSLVLDMIDQQVLCDSFTLAVGYDIENIDENFKGEIVIDYYGRKVPKSSHGSIRLNTYTSSLKEIHNKVIHLYNQIVNPALLIRRLTLVANHIVYEKDAIQQMDLFSDVKNDEDEKKIQKTILDIKKKYGKNSILKGTDLQRDATTIERNKQIGGHKA